MTFDLLLLLFVSIPKTLVPEEAEGPSRVEPDIFVIRHRSSFPFPNFALRLVLIAKKTDGW